MNVSPPQNDGSSVPVESPEGKAETRLRTTGESKEPADARLSLAKSSPIADASGLESSKADALVDESQTSKDTKDVAEGIVEKKRRRRKKWKKPKDKPSRPLSAYNLFFQKERAIMLGKDAPTDADEELKKRVHCKTHGKIGFAEMARAIGSKWKNLAAEEKSEYEEQASKEKKRYAEELAAWKEEQKSKSQRGRQTGTAPGLDAAAAGALGSIPGEGEMINPRPSDALGMMMSDQSQRSNVASLLQSRPGPDLATLEYIRALREHGQMDATLLGRSNLEAPLMEYPSAAEASANLLMQHFQGGLQGQSSLTPMDALRQQFQSGNDPSRAQASMDAFMQQLRTEQEEVARQQESVEALMQRLESGAMSESSRSQQIPQAATMNTLMQQLQSGLPTQDLRQHAMPSRHQLDLNLPNMAGMYGSNMVAAMRQLQQRHARGGGNEFNFQGGAGGGDLPPPL